MFTAVFLRNNESHIVSFKMTNGNYRTICGKVITRGDNVNTLAADNTFSGSCDICKKFYDEMYSLDLNHAPAEARSTVVPGIKAQMQHHEYHLVGDQHRYANMDHRFWPKLNKYQKLIPKAKGSKRKTRYE